MKDSGNTEDIFMKPGQFGNLMGKVGRLLIKELLKRNGQVILKLQKLTNSCIKHATLQIQASLEVKNLSLKISSNLSIFFSQNMRKS